MNKKILFIDDYLIGGGAEKVCQDSYNIMKKYFEVEIFYGTKNISKPKSIREYIYSKEYYNKLYTKLIEFKPQVIHIHNYYHILSPSILDAIKHYRKIYHVLIVYTAHDFHLLAPNSGYTYFNWFNNKLNMLTKPLDIYDIFLKKWDRRGIIYSLLKQLQWIINYKYKKLDNVIDVFITPSDFLSNLFVEKYSKPVYTVRNPINFIKNINRSKKHHDKKKELIFIGRLSPEKGLLEFILRIKKILINNNFFLSIIGDGEDLSKINTYLLENDLTDKIKILGRKSHKKTLSYLEKTHCLILPSLWYENAPLSLVEGAICENKLLTMPYGGMKEIAQICGNFAFLDDTDENIIKFINDTNFINKQAEIQDTFSLDKYIKELIHIYGE